MSTSRVFSPIPTMFTLPLSGPFSQLLSHLVKFFPTIPFHVNPYTPCTIATENDQQCTSTYHLYSSHLVAHHWPYWWCHMHVCTHTHTQYLFSFLKKTTVSGAMTLNLLPFVSQFHLYSMCTYVCGAHILHKFISHFTHKHHVSSMMQPVMDQLSTDVTKAFGRSIIQ